VAGKLPAALAGEDPAADNAERLALAEACLFRRHFEAARRLFAAAFGADPELAEDLATAARASAATCAALAGCGSGEDAGDLTAEERSARRGKALAWFKADLAARKKQLASGKAEVRAAVERVLSAWLASAELDATRGASRGGWPEEEWAGWDKFWAEVRAIRDDAQQAAVP
jgi:hypothetical protein